MKNLSVWFHIGFWVAYTLIFTIIEASYKEEYGEALVFEIVNMPMRLLVVYLNYFILLPRLLLKGRIAKYFLFTLSSLIIGGFIQRFISYESMSILYPEMDDFGPWLPYKFLQSMMIIASPLIFIIGVSIVWKVAQLQERAKVLENEKLQSELKYLKSQINPHFLFNTLNNIYGLSLENSKKTPDLILKLSDFLSFSLYESKQKFIPLSKEIQLMNDFIALEKDRFEDRVNVTITLPEDLQNITIPPLILVPFVENAFKHSLKNEIGIANIDIKLEFTNNDLVYSLSNSKSKEAIPKPKSHGIGLENIRKRLDIIYGPKYDLQITNEEERYYIMLKIKLQ
jgi:two-component system LytT family sensor kinase